MSSDGAARRPSSGRSSKPMRIFITFYSVCLILSTWIVAFVLQCLFWLLTKPWMAAGTQKYYLGLIFRTVSALVTAANPFWKFTLHGQLPKQRPRKVICMCNHVSNLDPFITCRALLPWESKYIAKSSLFKVPFGGWAMSMAGDVPVYFTAEKGGWGLAKGSVGKMMENCRWLVENGIPIMVFPEGARSGSMEPREYKDGMFKFALDNDCAILPLALNNTHRAWSRNDVLDCADIHVTIGELIEPATAGLRDVETLKQRVREEIVKLTHSLPNTCHDPPRAEKKEGNSAAVQPAAATKKDS